MSEVWCAVNTGFGDFPFFVGKTHEQTTNRTLDLHVTRYCLVFPHPTYEPQERQIAEKAFGL